MFLVLIVFNADSKRQMERKVEETRKKTGLVNQHFKNLRKNSL